MCDALVVMKHPSWNCCPKALLGGMQWEQKVDFMRWGCSSVVECLPNIGKALGLIPSIPPLRKSSYNRVLVSGGSSRSIQEPDRWRTYPNL